MTLLTLGLDVWGIDDEAITLASMECSDELKRHRYKSCIVTLCITAELHLRHEYKSSAGAEWHCSDHDYERSKQG